MTSLLVVSLGEPPVPARYSCARGRRKESRRDSAVGSLEALTLRDRAGVEEEVEADARFLLIGGEPHTEWLPEEIARDRNGSLLTGRDLSGAAADSFPVGHPPLPLETSMPGVFAAGDVRYGSIKRVASAVGDGATVIRIVHEHLEDAPPLAAPSVTTAT